MKNKIKAQRLKLGITQDELAQKAGVRRETIVFLEQGKYNPSLVLAHSVARALKTEIKDLFDLK
ncbi:MAG: helix-turn-helix transcriptional regulator [Patescibacteria group bacterium]|nr:helix-turn-helix transcriptional regulator [Patescibacteria group bacterium]